MLSEKIIKSIGRNEYEYIHIWLNSHYGKAFECENRENNILDFKCNLKSNCFQWALIKDKDYERKRDNYIQLCCSCHRSYDYILETGIKISKRLKGRQVFTKEQYKKLGKKRRGRIVPHNSRIVLQYYLVFPNGKKLIKTFPSISETERVMGWKSCSLSSAFRNNKSDKIYFRGFVWERLHKPIKGTLIHLSK